MVGERVYDRVEANPYTPEHIERLVRYGERLATGMLPIVEPMPGKQPLPQPTFRRYPSWQEHDLELSLSGLLVGRLNVNLLEGCGVSQLFLNLHYIFPRTYLVDSRVPPGLTSILINGRSLFIDDRQRVGAVAHVRDVFEGGGNNATPFWALKTLNRYKESPWPIVHAYRASDAVGTFQRATSRGALQGIQAIYDEVAAEYGYISFRQFSWQQFQSPLRRRII